jgi:hypothetical protein
MKKQEDLIDDGFEYVLTPGMTEEEQKEDLQRQKEEFLQKQEN